ncbi:reverse transcriptase domain-containing protein [Schumannella luteola]
MTKKIRGGEWSPNRPGGFQVPKSDGSFRTVSAFEIADEVISRRLFLSLFRKNHALFSGHSYAYSPGLTPHDAIRYISTELRREQRIFVAEYDFRKFFDNVSHEYFWKAARELGAIMSPIERRLLESFLRAPEPYLSPAAKTAKRADRTVGIPQGTSTSLFIANLVATELDRSLEKLGVGFTRYADDTLVWGRSYDQILEAVHFLHEASDAIGSPVNVEKSNGVRLLVPAGTKYFEMAATETVDFLGHSVGLRRVSLKREAMLKVKDRVNELLYTNLLKEPLGGTQNMARVTGSDRDYVTFIWQLRRYLYGSLSENQVRRFQRGAVPAMSFKGLMSFYPLVDDDEQLRQLDEWIAAQAWLALRRRAKLLRAVTPPPTWSISKKALIGLRTRSSVTGKPLDLRLPSVRRIASVISTAVAVHGLAVVGNTSRLYLYDQDDDAKIVFL